MSQGIVEAGDWHVCGVYVSVNYWGKDFSPGGCSVSFSVVSLVVGDWRNFGSNCASAICIRTFLGEIKL